MATARHRAILTEAEKTAEEAGAEQVMDLLLKQKGYVEGEWLACDHCTTWGFGSQVSHGIFLFFVFC